VTKNRITPFSCGTQFGDWQERNCENCNKFDSDNPDNSNCEIDEALLIAYFDDGTVSAEIAKRMGYTDKEDYTCHEIELRHGQQK